MSEDNINKSPSTAASHSEPPLTPEELERRLANSRRMEALGSLVSGLVHDFNDIFTPLLGFAELARDEVEEGSEHRHNIEMVIKAGNRAKKLVKRLLAFTQFSEQASSTVSVKDVVEGELARMSPAFPSCVKVVRNFEKNLGRVLADGSKIAQVVANLVDNAMDAMREAGGAMTIDLSSVDYSPREMLKYPELRSASCVRMIVKDTGPGIPPDVIHHVFEPFFTTKKYGDAKGVGLSVVQGIVKGLGGAVSLHSEPGRGCEFVVLLPVHQEVGKLRAAKSLKAADGARSLDGGGE